jgi:lipoprotein-releasing system permease protein
VLRQLGQFAMLLAQMAGLGVALAIWRRTLHWRAVAAGLATLGAGLFAVGLCVSRCPANELNDALLWGGGAAACLLTGLMVGAVCRRIGFWESYLCCASGGAGLALQLGLGGGQLLRRLLAALPEALQAPAAQHLRRHTGTARAAAGDAFATLSPGLKWLGPMWDRLLLLAVLGGFLLAVIGGSLAYLLQADLGGKGLTQRFEWQVARRHLQGRHHSSISVMAVVAVLGIALGVASLVSVTAVMSGYEQDIQQKILGTNAHIVVQKYGTDFTEYRRTQKLALAVPGVVAAAPFAFNEAMLSTGDTGVGVMLKGVVPKEAVQVTDIGRHMCRPEGLPERCLPPHSDNDRGLEEALQALPQAGVQSSPAVVVGWTLFARLGKPLGSRVLLTVPVAMAGARGSSPKRMAYRLAGVFRSGMHEFDARLVYLQLHDAQALLSMPNTVSGLELRVATPEKVERLALQVYQKLGRYPYTTRDWRELNAGIFTALKLQKVVMFLVLCCIVVVASFNIASTLFMAVVEKAADIATLKSMGAKDASIMAIFVLQGWMTGVVGTGSGVALGLLAVVCLSHMQISIAPDVYMVGTLQVKVVPQEIFLTVAAALCIAHLATLYPALQAAHRRPVDAMRAD